MIACRAGKVRYIGCVQPLAALADSQRRSGSRSGATSERFPERGQAYYTIAGGADLERGKSCLCATIQQLAILPWSPLGGAALFEWAKYSRDTEGPAGSRPRCSFDFPPVETRTGAYKVNRRNAADREGPRRIRGRVAIAWAAAQNRRSPSVIIGAKEQLSS